MSGIARINDIGIGICPCHKSPVQYTTTFISGAGSVTAEGLSVCNLGTMGVSTCGHMTSVLTVSGSVLAEGTGVHRIGDSGQNCGTYNVISGAGTVTAG